MARMTRQETLSYILPLVTLLPVTTAAKYANVSYVTLMGWKSGLNAPSINQRENLDRANRRLIRYLNEQKVPESTFFEELIEFLNTRQVPQDKGLTSPTTAELKRFLSSNFATRTYARPVIEKAVAMGYNRTRVYKVASELGIIKEIKGKNGPNARSYWRMP